MGALRASCILGLVALTGSAGIAPANPRLEFSGHGRETGGLAISSLGDTLWIVGMITGVEDLPGLPYTPAQCEYSFAITGLISSGEHIEFGINHVIVYSGGLLEIFADPQFNADWTAPQSESSPPAGFHDGSLLFSATMEPCRLTYATGYPGMLYGRIEACGGSAMQWLNLMAYWVGDREETPTELAALGYDLTITGRLGVWWDDPVLDCWGAIKALY